MAGCVSLGVCYYPEHWDRSLWESDLLRMTDVGITTVRIAEFSWSITERTEGNFTFDFFDGFLDLCERVGMNVIMCTPTATPPAWLTEKYPESLNADINGVRYGHGSRRHYNYNSPKYRELSARVAVRLRSGGGEARDVIRAGGLTLDAASRSVEAGGARVRLTRTEYAILRLLMANAGQVITKTQLLDRISNDTPDCTESSLKTHVSHLRTKLKAACGRDLVESVWGIGYKLDL